MLAHECTVVACSEVKGYLFAKLHFYLGHCSMNILEVKHASPIKQSECIAVYS